MATLALMSGATAGGETQGPQVGEAPPPLGRETILQAPPGTQASWASLEGRVVVLEFWATWCGPCMAAIPHLNEMADQRDTREMDVLVLTAGTQPAEHLSPTVSTGGSSSNSGGGSLNGVNQGIESIAASLEGFLGKPVVDETRLTNHYDFQLLWDETGSEDVKRGRITTAVREQLGVELKPAKRPIEVLVVEAAIAREN
jgi:hypothetical protein